MRFAQARFAGAVSTLLILFSWHTFARAAGPSFPCAGATAPIDRAICASPELSALDVTLSQAFRAALAADPAGRVETQRNQRAWLKGRADACHLPGQGQATGAQTACLTGLTKDRIAILQPRDPDDAALATRIADAMRHHDGFIDQGGDLADALGRLPESPVRFTPDGEALTAALAAKLPPFDGIDDMKKQGAAYRFGDHPSMLAVAAMEGTAHCWYYTLFRANGATYETVPSPDGSEDGHCGETISFGSTSEAGLPLFADATYGVEKSTLLILAFRGGGWHRVGDFALDFETALGMEKQSCAAQAPCAALAAAALQLARARDAAVTDAPDHLGAAVRTAAPPQQPEEGPPAFGNASFDAWSTFETDAPVYRLAAAGDVAMRISHGTIGWRTNEDYIVAAYRHDGGTWRPVAGFQIGKKRVRLRSVTVE